MLAVVLLDVVEASVPIHHPLHLVSIPVRGVEQMKRFTFALLGVHHWNHPQSTAVARLAASLGVERGLVQNDRQATVELERSKSSRAKPRQVGIGQVKSLGHVLLVITSQLACALDELVPARSSSPLTAYDPLAARHGS